MGWADDPELVATFRAEVEERLASLCEGLLRLEGHPSPRQLVSGLFRDAHTVKGSARMLGLDGVVDVAHRAEDLLGALRDNRIAPMGAGTASSRLADTEGEGSTRTPTRKWPCTGLPAKACAHPRASNTLAKALHGIRPSMARIGSDAG